MKLNIGVIFGGKSVEHEISVITALQAMDNIDKEKYEIIPIYITKDLVWYTGGMLRHIDSYKDFRLIDRYAKKVNLVNQKGRFILQLVTGLKKEIKEIHLAFPIVHGKGCEDGTIQGYLSTLGIPCAGSDVYASALGQDKIFTKQLLEHNNIPVTNYVWFYDTDYYKNEEELFKKINKLDYPLIIKPARLGSSIGIEIIKRKEELESSIEKVLKYDERFLIEEYIEDKKEYNCAVIGTYDKIQTSAIEEIINEEGICTYQDKYTLETDDNPKIKKIYPAEINKRLEEDIEIYSKEIFRLLCAKGCLRVDFLYDSKKKKIYVDEVNIIPTYFSHHLWPEKNVDYRALMDIMINQAIESARKDKQEVLDNKVLENLKSKDVRELK